MKEASIDSKDQIKPPEVIKIDQQIPI